MELCLCALKKWFFPPNQGSLSTIHVHVLEEIEQEFEDQSGTVIPFETFLAPYVATIVLTPEWYHPRYIINLLKSYIPEDEYCRILAEIIARQCSLGAPFQLSLTVKLTRRVRILLPSDVVVQSKGASDYVLQRLVQEQRVESMNFEEEEEDATCSICIDKFSETHDQDIIRMPSCSHMFHQDCIFEWLKEQNSCPLCRQVPYKEEEEYITRTPFETEQLFGW